MVHLKRLGFNLAELLMAIAILGVISALVIPTFLNNTNERDLEPHKQAVTQELLNTLNMANTLIGYLPDSFGPAQVYEKYTSYVSYTPSGANVGACPVGGQSSFKTPTGVIVTNVASTWPEDADNDPSNGITAGDYVCLALRGEESRTLNKDVFWLLLPRNKPEIHGGEIANCTDCPDGSGGDEVIPSITIGPRPTNDLNEDNQPEPEPIGPSITLAPRPSSGPRGVCEPLVQGGTYSGSGSAIAGTSGADTLNAVGNKNRIATGMGDDEVKMSGNYNRILSGGGADSLQVSGNRNLVATGNGSDYNAIDGNANRVRSDSGSDTNVVVGNANRVNSGGGDDFNTVTGNQVRVNSGYGSDTNVITGNQNRLRTGSGSDTNVVMGNQNGVVSAIAEPLPE